MADQSSKLDITFATKTSKKDWTRFLAGAFERKSDFYPFKHKILYLNNEVPQDIVWPYETYDVIAHMDEILDFFELKNHDFRGGLWFSIAELAAIYNCKTKYLCYVQSDTLLTADNHFVDKAIQILQDNPNIAVVSPLSEVNTWHDKEGLDHFFSDQLWVVRTDEFRKAIYNYKTPVLNEYPSYGGANFERLVGRYLHRTKRYRKIIEESWYEHPTW